MNDRFKFRIPEFTDKGSFIGFQYVELGDEIECTLCGYNGEFEQSTGLKDKNGKLIYEGDVVSDKSNHIRVVVWEQDCFKYPALKTSRYFHRPISNQLEERKIGLKGKLTFQDAIGKCDKKHFEVIGNIYENKSLLESEG